MKRIKSIPIDNASISAKHIVLHSDSLVHWHDCCEMELVLSGRGTHTINGHVYPFRPGDLYFFTQADYHSICVEEPIELIGFMFDESLLDETLFSSILSAEMTNANLLVTLTGDHLIRTEGYFSTLLQEISNTPAQIQSELYIKNLLNCIVIELLRHARDAHHITADRQLITSAILYLHRHYSEPITLTSLANYLHLAPGYLSTYFKNNAGRSFKDYLIDLRLRHACRLLVNTNMSVTDICFSCGFSSYSHFMRTFRTHYDTSPLQFRRYHQDNIKNTSHEKG